jgi:universal stress protein A
MSVYQHILIAIDFSESSAKALKKTLQLADKLDARIELIHVVDIPIYPVLEDVAVLGLPGIWDDEQAKSLMSLSEEKLKKLADKYQIKDYKTVEGVPESEITAIATVNKVDLIVMGFHGLSGFRTLIGSTTHSVINNAPCDVLAIKLDV